jgi:RND family efflux transporter MFP subunit
MRVMPGMAILAMVSAACGGKPDSAPSPSETVTAAVTYTVRDTVVTATFDATGVAEAVQHATLSTKLMGNVVAVLVQEGDRVRAGQPLMRLDAREVESKRTQVDAGIAAAEAVYQDALAQAGRFRALYADSAATKYQLEQVETGLARAEAGLRTARAARAELDAVASYSEVRAPFAGIVTRRMADPGAFAAPGAPLLEVQDPSRLRVSVSIPPAVAAGLRRGAPASADIEGRPAQARIEGVVPSGAGTVYTVNALVDNSRGEFLPGSAAVVHIPTGTRRAILLPVAALLREGDLVGVRVVTPGGPVLRWVRTGAEAGPGSAIAGGERGPAPEGREELVEVLSGLAPGDVVLIGER